MKIQIGKYTLVSTKRKIQVGNTGLKTQMGKYTSDNKKRETQIEKYNLQK